MVKLKTHVQPNLLHEHDMNMQSDGPTTPVRV